LPEDSLDQILSPAEWSLLGDVLCFMDEQNFFIQVKLWVFKVNKCRVFPSLILGLKKSLFWLTNNNNNNKNNKNQLPIKRKKWPY
jgi:hypothetical protein